MIIKAPWAGHQAIALNDWQLNGRMHPFACGAEGCRGILIADRSGWYCPVCDYTQDWAHDFMMSPAAPEKELK